MNTFTIIIQIIELLVLGITAFAIWRTLNINNESLKTSNEALKISNKSLELSNKTLKSNHDWNRRKTTHEILGNFIIGDIPKLTSSLKLKFNCKIYDEKSNYSSFIANLDSTKKDKFDDTLIRLLNIFEVIAIDIKNHIIEEDISYDYLVWFFTSSYKFSKELIEQKRKDAGDNRVFINFTNLAQKWDKRKSKELSPKETKGKEKL